MSNIGKPIDWQQARQLAEQAVMRDVDSYESREVQKALEDEFLEAEHCWIFFRNREISVRPEKWFTRAYNAFAISKTGAFSQIATLEYDEAQLNAYLNVMSDYFARKEK